MTEGDPSDFDQPSTEPDQRQALDPTETAFLLTVTSGPDAGKELTVDWSQGSRILVGRGPACALSLSDPEVARRHAALEPGRAGGIRLSDLGSAAGTYVEKIKTIEAELAGGESIRLGGTTFRVERAAGLPLAEPPPGAGF